MNIIKVLLTAAITLICLSVTVTATGQSDEWTLRFTPGIGFGMPSSEKIGHNTAMQMKLSTDVHLSGSFVIRMPLNFYTNGGIRSTSQTFTFLGSIGPLLRSRLSSNPDFPSEFYLFVGGGIVKLNPPRGGQTRPIVDLSIGLAPALSKWLSLDVAFDLPIIVILQEGMDFNLYTFAGLHAGLVFGI